MLCAGQPRFESGVYETLYRVVRKYSRRDVDRLPVTKEEKTE